MASLGGHGHIGGRVHGWPLLVRVGKVVSILAVTWWGEGGGHHAMDLQGGVGGYGHGRRQESVGDEGFVWWWWWRLFVRWRWRCVVWLDA